MSKKKIKNVKYQAIKHNKINYKIEFEKLKKQNIQLQTENSLLKAFNRPTATQKIEILEEYYDWVVEEGNDANAIYTIHEYKKKLKKQTRFEND